MLNRFDMGDKIKDFFGLIFSKPANFKPSVGMSGTSRRFLSVNLIGIRRFG